MRGKWETLVVSVTEKHRETDAITDRRHGNLLPQERGHRLTEENPRKVLVPEDRIPLAGKAGNRAKKSSKGLVRIRRVIFGILPYVKFTNLTRDANSATNVCSGHTVADGQPIQKSNKSGGESSVALLKESLQLGCVSQDYPLKKSILRESGKWGSNPTVVFSQGTRHHFKKIGTETVSSSQGVLATRKMRPQRSMGLGKRCL